jgi:hypothetical protein
MTEDGEELVLAPVGTKQRFRLLIEQQVERLDPAIGFFQARGQFQ